jgi:hypothetical protein
MAKQYYPRPIILRLNICFRWKKKANQGGRRAHRRIDFEFEYLGFRI